MSYIWVLSILLGLSAFASAQERSVSKEGSWLDVDRLLSHCAEPNGAEDVVWMNDFPFNPPREMSDLSDLFEETYERGQRLNRRAYFDPDLGEIRAPVPRFGLRPIATVPWHFVATVQTQVERALNQAYADYVFFPDLGHSHFLIPQESWDSIYSYLSSLRGPEFYEELLQDPELKILYHTGEQIRFFNEETGELLPDRYAQWRYFSRNPVGPNQAFRSFLQVLFNSTPGAYNTVRSLDGHRWYSSGFYIHASRNGCFSFRDSRGELKYYDLSFFSLPYRSGQSGWGDWDIQRNPYRLSGRRGL